MTKIPNIGTNVSNSKPTVTIKYLPSVTCPQIVSNNETINLSLLQYLNSKCIQIVDEKVCTTIDYIYKKNIRGCVSASLNITPASVAIRPFSININYEDSLWVGEVTVDQAQSEVLFSIFNKWDIISMKYN